MKIPIPPSWTWHTLQKLSDFGGATAVVAQLELPQAASNRLQSMGIYEGQFVQLCRVGRNVILTAAGGRVAITDELARHILVQSPDGRSE